MKSQHKMIADIIAAYVSGKRPGRCLAIDDRSIDSLYNLGLGPIVLSALGDEVAALSEYANYRLQSADLTARTVYGEIRDTTLEVLEIADRHGIPVVLLKGIAAAGSLYPHAHHRTMGDVDVLVPQNRASEFQTLLVDAGFVPDAGDDGTHSSGDHHHLPTLFHRRHRIAIEVHTALFSTEPLASEALFSIDSVWHWTKAGQFHGKPCLLLRREYAFCYTLAHWAKDGKWAVNLLSLCDLLLFMRRDDAQIDWMLIDSWLVQSTNLATYLMVFFAFAEREGIAGVPDVLADRLAETRVRTGTVNLAVLLWLIRTFPLSGQRKVAWVMTRTNALTMWRTLLEPGHKSLRMILATKRILLRRYPGRSYLSTFAGRLRTLVSNSQ